jgi:glycosyltransferase involved in cell wall biosynthesis
MNKNTCVIYAPVQTFSGYGARGRDVAKAIIELKKEEWDIKIIPCKWGNTPMNFIEENPEWKYLEEYFTQQLTQQPDIMIWITVPNEFQPVGKYNIGITAGIESTIAPSDWVEGCQRMDLVLGSSKHTIEVLKNSKFEKRDQNTNQNVGLVEWTRDSDILFEGARTDVYQPTTKPCMVDFNVKEEFAYLFVGHWMQGEVGEDRKNVGLLIKAFYETFKNKTKKPALILKTTQVGASYMDRDNILKKIAAIRQTVKSTNLPNIYLLHGEFTDEEMNSIYNHSKVKAMVNLTKGEGFGRPLLEFSLTNKPIITTNWSGHVDYLNPEFTTLLPGQLTNIHPSAANNMLLKEAQWFSVDHGHVGHYLKDMFENYKNYTDKAKRQGYYSRTNFSFEKMKEKLDGILTERIPEFPKQIQIKLPQLKKPGLPEMKKIELPKLKKVEA